MAVVLKVWSRNPSGASGDLSEGPRGQNSLCDTQMLFAFFTAALSQVCSGVVQRLCHA